MRPVNSFVTTPPVQFGWGKKSKAKPNDKPPYIALVELNGPITGSGSRAILKALEQVKELKYPVAILRINSPGGTAGASEEIHEEVMRLRKAGTKVVVSIGDIAASGGFLVASAADEIVAPGMSVTGSIGVILQLRSMADLQEKVGIRQKSLTAGELKDLSNLDAYLDEVANAGEKPGLRQQVLEGLLSDQHDQFIRKVLDGRNSAISEDAKALTEADIRGMADGRIFTGQQALQLHLIDKLGGLSTAIDSARELIGQQWARVIPVGGNPNASPLNRFGNFLRKISGARVETETALLPVLENNVSPEVKV